MNTSLEKENIAKNWQGWKAAVAIVLVKDKNGEKSLVLVKRSETMPTHPGDISFFGGFKKDEESDPRETALRELAEESDLEKTDFVFIKYLGHSYSKYGGKVIPVIFEYQEGEERFLDKLESNGEWDYLYIVSLVKLLDKQSGRWQRGEFVNFKKLQEARPIYFYPLYKHDARKVEILTSKDLLWGLTAQIIINNYKCLQELKEY